MKPPYLTSPSEITDAVKIAVEPLVCKVQPTPGQPDSALLKPWLNQKQCEAYCGVSKATLARWRASGLLPNSKIGQLLFYRREDVDRLLASRRQRPSTPAVAATMTMGP